ncbi:NAD-dependent epimerase/dehydratase family protein [Dyadobacter subterraneus]|uniref:Oxidoreductase n=1 Tax=Dyadobacter subterraneus TaxID=2773304 RepID=A0ABR9WA16_9BACT|nr:NAD-dependent epimerase/dehydratase family protein [Dyadobacter subterraneus]MBE9461226.1 oxidoreductase [Dyadobacter subterraneus]
MSYSSNKTALIIGATGLVGKQVLNYLLASPIYNQIKILTRRSSGIQHEKLNEIFFDFDKPDANLVKADDIFCCLGTTIKKAGSEESFKKVDFQYPLQIGRLGKLNGASKYLIVSSMGADSKSFIFYNRVKGEIEKELTDLHYDTLHILRPSLLLGDRGGETRLGEKIGEVLAKILDPVMIGPLRKYAAIDSAKVARGMLELAQSPQKGVFVHNSAELQRF